MQLLIVFLSFDVRDFLVPTCLPINSTGVGIKPSADQVKAAYVGSVFQSSVLVEKLTGHNSTEDISFVKAIEELSETATAYPSQRKLQEELDNSAVEDNLLGKNSFAISFSTAIWCLVIRSTHSNSGTTLIFQ